MDRTTRPINRNDLLSFHADFTKQALDLLMRKNKQYAPNDADAFGNLLACEHLGICSAPKAILIRLLDKVHRLNTLLDSPNEKSTAGDALGDTLLDLLNYTILIAATTCGEAFSKEGQQKIRETLSSASFLVQDCGGVRLHAPVDEVTLDRSRKVREEMAAEVRAWLNTPESIGLTDRDLITLLTAVAVVLES